MTKSFGRYPKSEKYLDSVSRDYVFLSQNSDDTQFTRSSTQAWVSMAGDVFVVGMCARGTCRR